MALVRNLLPTFYSSPHTFGGKVGEVSQRILFGRAPGSNIPEVGMKRPSPSRSIIAQYQILYMRLSLSPQR